MAKSVDDGSSWSDGVPVDPSTADPGHQFFSDVDAYAGLLVAIWQDNRTDDDYSVQLPLGNRLDAQNRAVSGTDVVGSYAATSTDGVTWTPLGMVSATTHQPSYEMFGNRDIPFQGDYNWVAIADANGPAAGGRFAYAAWTDNRQVVPGEDPRETEAQDGFVDGFDVQQCRIDLGAVEGAVNPDVPLARADAPTPVTTVETEVGSTRTSSARGSHSTESVRCRWAGQRSRCPCPCGAPCGQGHLR